MYVNNLGIIIVYVSMISKYIILSTLVIADTLDGDRDLVSVIVRVHNTGVRTKFPISWCRLSVQNSSAFCLKMSSLFHFLA